MTLEHKIEVIRSECIKFMEDQVRGLAKTDGNSTKYNFNYKEVYKEK